MTQERDFDRLARAWLEQGPHEVPDRVVATVLQAVDTTPQVRRGVRLPLWRSVHMPRLSVGATLVAALLVVGLGGGILLTQSHGLVVAGPSTTPSTAASATMPASPSLAAETVPATLQGTWIGAPRDITGLAETQRYRFILGASSLGFPNDQLTQSTLTSDASTVASDTLIVISRLAGDGCRAGDTGRYEWNLSPGGGHLSLTPAGDACATRLLALQGDWLRVACKNISDGCLGDLEAGTYPSQYIDPTLDPGGSWAPRFGAISYTVPDGWANSADWPDTFSLTPTLDYAREGPNGPPDHVFHEIYLLAQPAATAITADCRNSEITTAGRTADDLVTWLGNQRALTVSGVTTTTIDGHTARWLDISLASDWTGTCPGDSVPGAPFLMQASSGTDGNGIGIANGERMRLFLVDLGRKDVLAIAIDSTYPDRFDQLVEQAMPIISSFTFR